MDSTNVLLLHNDEVGWAAVRAALQERDGIGTIGEARTHDSALFHASTNRIDLLLTSDRLAGASSHSTLAELRATSCRDCLIAMFINGLEAAELERFGGFELAACCRWDELSTTEAMDAALAAILTGDLLVSTRKVADDYFQFARGTIQMHHDAVQVSDLDRQILALLAQGLSDKEIGQRVNRAPKTVGHRLDDLRARLGAKNRPHLIHLAHQLRFI